MENLEEIRRDMESLKEIRERPETVLEVVREIVETFKPDDLFIISVIKKLAMELEDSIYLMEIRNTCNNFESGYQSIALTDQEIKKAKNKLKL